MLFNSLPFVILFLVTYSLYLALNHRWQNRLLLAASLIFYGWWDWRFLSLLFISIGIDFVCGLGMGSATSPGRRRAFLVVAVCGDLGILFFFKYFNFFCESWVTLLQLFGYSGGFEPFNIILPLGISFYTFQAMSYTIDVYRGHLQPVRSAEDFVLYVMFFPQLVAGPIERATDLLPRILAPRRITLASFQEGCALLLTGFFKKMVIADNLAPVVHMVFDASDAEVLTGMEVLLGVYAFAFQIYGDFSGYSDIARGLAKVMGFDLMLNFRRPYFATNPSDFWRRWHVSLSTWLRDYLYIPLGGSRRGIRQTYRNLALTMLLGGLWHGAAVHFVLWGFYHGLLLAVHRMMTSGSDRSEAGQETAFAPGRLIRMVGMFHLVCAGWILFRVTSNERLALLVSELITDFRPADFRIQILAPLVYYVPMLLAYEVLVERRSWGASGKERMAPGWARPLVYAFMLAMLVSHGVIQGAEFIYFQF